MGKSWRRVDGPLQISSLDALAAVGSTILASGTSRLPLPDKVSVYRSADQGKTWTPAGRGLGSQTPRAFALSGSNLFAIAGRGVYVTSDNGDNWTAANTGLPENSPVLSIAASGPNLIAGTLDKGVFLSTNNGRSWSAINTYLPQDGAAIGLLAIGSNLFAVIATQDDEVCPGGGVLIDGRCFAALIPGQIPPLPTFRSTVFHSPNLGRSWAPIKAGLGDADVTTLSANGSTVFAGTAGRGIFVRQF